MEKLDQHLLFQYLDYNVADLRKKLNKLRYETKVCHCKKYGFQDFHSAILKLQCRSATVDGLVKEYGKACEMKAEKVNHSDFKR